MKNKAGKSKKSWRMWANIFLSLLLTLGILSSGFGGYTLAQSLTQTPSQSQPPEGSSPPGPDDTPTQEIPFTDIPGGDGLNNSMKLKDTVTVLAGDAAAAVNASVRTVEVLETSFGSGDRLEIVCEGSREELFGALSYGDIFVLEGDGNSFLGETSILKVDSLYENYDGTIVLRTSQPYFDEVFDSIALDLLESVKPENLIESATAPGVDMHFGRVEEEFPSLASDNGVSGAAKPADEDPRAQPLGLADGTGMAIQPLATEYTTEPQDFICTIDFDLKKAKEKEKDDDDGVLDIDADFDLKLLGKFGIKDLSAYMVCDMPSPLQFNELFFGARGEMFYNFSFNTKLSASIQGKATEIKGSFLGAKAKASALNQKLIPLGIWLFVGSTPIKIDSSIYKSLSVSPSFYFMVYADWEGNISFEFTASFEQRRAVNGGLRVVKDGKLSMSMENYPYNVGNEGTSNNDDGVWSVELSLQADTDITLFGSSFLFCVAGLTIGEFSLVRLGLEAECDISVKASSDKGVELPSPQNNSSYLRGYLKLGEVKVRLKANINVFWHDWGFEFNFEFCMLDYTIFIFGNMPDRYRPVNPISSLPYPSEFTSVITLVCDVSGSMDSATGSGESKIQAARTAGSVITGMVRDWSEKYPGVYGVGLVQFANSAKTMAFPHTDYPFIEACIRSIGDGGGTNIASGLELGIDQLQNVKADSKVIILMTDGQDNNHSGILEQAEQAKAMNIRVFTVGFGSDTDEDILRQVANTTGGDYRFADTKDIVGIIGSFMYAQQASEAKVLADHQGTVAEGQTTAAKPFNVPDETGDLNAILYWPGSVLDLIVTDPNGREVDADYPGATIDRSSIPASIVVSDPLPGSWKMRVRGVETSYDEEPFYAITSFKRIERADTEVYPALDTITMLGACALPAGSVAVLLSLMLLFFINARKKRPQRT